LRESKGVKGGFGAEVRAIFDLAAVTFDKTEYNNCYIFVNWRSDFPNWQSFGPPNELSEQFGEQLFRNEVD
jgi:hypothetical protein